MEPKCPRSDVPKSEAGSASPEKGAACKPSYSAILKGAPVSVKKADQSEGEEAKSNHEQSFATNLDVGGLFLASESDSVAVLDTGATANLVCSRWLGKDDSLLT